MHDSPRISIVDDDLSVRRALCRLCKAAGYVVESFESAEKFLKDAIADETDCLVLDIHLPGMSGLQLQSELRFANKHYPIVIMTALEDEQLRKQALEGGAVELLRKPLDSEHILDVIEKALED